MQIDRFFNVDNWMRKNLSKEEYRNYQQWYGGYDEGNPNAAGRLALNKVIDQLKQSPNDDLLLINSKLLTTTWDGIYAPGGVKKVGPWLTPEKAQSNKRYFVIK